MKSKNLLALCCPRTGWGDKLRLGHLEQRLPCSAEITWCRDNWVVLHDRIFDSHWCNSRLWSYPGSKFPYSNGSYKYIERHNILLIFCITSFMEIFFRTLRENIISKMAHHLMAILKVSWLVLMEDWFSWSYNEPHWGVRCYKQTIISLARR